MLLRMRKIKKEIKNGKEVKIRGKLKIENYGDKKKWKIEENSEKLMDLCDKKFDLCEKMHLWQCVEWKSGKFNSEGLGLNYLHFMVLNFNGKLGNSVFIEKLI